MRIDSGARRGQYNFLQGGNPDLEPEKARTYTFGGAPAFPTWSATVDYWHYKIENVIGVVPSQTALNNCVNSGTLCNLIFRGPNGNLAATNSGYVSGINQNLGSLLTDGIDVTFNYNYPMDQWVVSVSPCSGRGQPVRRREHPGSGTYDCAGLYGPTVTLVPALR
jgi:outer membrane receptor protein involved in Fe transport